MNDYRGTVVQRKPRHEATNVVEVLDRSADRALSPRHDSVFAVDVGEHRGFVVVGEYDRLTVGEFHRLSQESEWQLYQKLVRPIEPTQQVLLPDFPRPSIESLGQRVLSEHEAAVKKMLETRAERKEHLGELLERWADAKARKGMPEYAALAWAYSQEVTSGNSKATATLADRFGCSSAVMAQRVKEARRRGLLTPGQQGRASGAITSLGELYTRPEFEGLAAYLQRGKTVKWLASRFGITEAEVGAALAAEGAAELARNQPATDKRGRREGNVDGNQKA